ncbi:MAG: inositol monophosphatase family protein [Acidobacteria bacterium]|nr:inositol monophosphatase family protein [Acidobacteriota bacterium]
MKGAIDLVTEVDIEVEQMCRRVLGERFPSHAVLAEEEGGHPAATAGTSEYCWIFDPIDGTTNYAHGLPIFCASLALEIRGRVDVAAVYDPTRRELFTAQRGVGAFLNGSRMAVSTPERLLDSVLVTGFPYDIHQNPGDVLGLFGAFVTRARAVRRLGSAALDLCYVAAGRLDGFWEANLHPWDVAAGALLVEEAGGQVRGMDGTPFDARARHVAAAGPALLPRMLEVIADFQAGRSLIRTS